VPQTTQAPPLGFAHICVAAYCGGELWQISQPREILGAQI